GTAGGGTAGARATGSCRRPPGPDGRRSGNGSPRRGAGRRAVRRGLQEPMIRDRRQRRRQRPARRDGRSSTAELCATPQRASTEDALPGVAGGGYSARMIDAATEERVNQLRRLDEELETILTSFDTSYAWNYGNVKEGLRDLYEKAKRDQWNGTTQLAWDTDVDPERGILPDVINPLAGYPP